MNMAAGMDGERGLGDQRRGWRLGALVVALGLPNLDGVFLQGLADVVVPAIKVATGGSRWR